MKITAGLDEVGRGALAGPLITGCVVIDHTITRPSSIIITDSKKMTHIQRLRAAEWIYKHADAWGIGIVSPGKIDKLGLTKAANIAFRQAIKKTNSQINIEELYIDAFYVPQVVGIPRKRQHPVIGGDMKIFSISAASIIAKVYRDELMSKLHHQYLHYQWDKNKGYGTRVHREAIQKYGPTRLHRKLFIRNI